MCVPYVKQVFHCVRLLLCLWTKETSWTWPDTTRFLTTVFLCSEFKLKNIYSGVNFCAKNVCGYFSVAGTYFRIAGKIAKIAKIRTRKNFVPHGKTQSVGFRLHTVQSALLLFAMASKKLQLCKKTNKQTKTGDELVFMSVPNYSQTSLYGHPVYTDSF